MKDNMLELIINRSKMSEREERFLKALMLKLVTEYVSYVGLHNRESRFEATGLNNGVREYNDLAYNVFYALLKDTSKVDLMYAIKHKEVVNEVKGYLEDTLTEDKLNFLQENALNAVVFLRTILKKCETEMYSQAL